MHRQFAILGSGARTSRISSAALRATMSRGWESKDVESQINSFEQRVKERSKPMLTPEQLEVRARRESLLMDRMRVERDLAAARHPRHQQMLRDALGHLDEKLAELPPDPVS